MSTAEIIGRYIHIDGNRTFYDECGEGAPVICIHAGAADSRIYQYLLPELAARGYRGLALDLPGHSRSNPVDWEPHRTIHQHAEYVFKFAREVRGGEKPIVIGCAIGGTVAFDLVANHSAEFRAIVPMEGPAWCEPILPFPGELERPSWSTAWKPFIEYGTIESLGRPTRADAEKVKEFWWLHQNAQQAGNGDIQGWAKHDVRDKLDDVRCPVLVIKGTDDFWVPEVLIRESAELIGEMAEVEILPDIGHYPMFEDPVGLAELVDDFVQRRAPQD